MLEITNDINKSVLSENCVLESFDVANIFACGECVCKYR